MNRKERRKYWCEGEGLEKVRTMMIDNCSQGEIADKIGVSTNTLYRWRENSKALDNVIACKGVRGIENKRVYNGKSGIGRDYTNVYYMEGSEVFWCNQCRGFYNIEEYVEGNRKCRDCNILNGRLYRNTKQGKEVKRRHARKYYKENKDHIYEMVYKRHNAVLENEYNYNSSMWEEVLGYFHNQCAYCGSCGDLEREHVIPVSKGGGYVRENIIPACRYCNRSKLDRDMENWYKEYRHYDEGRLNKIKKWIGA